jgi:hypothetical protein
MTTHGTGFTGTAFVTALTESSTGNEAEHSFVRRSRTQSLVHAKPETRRAENGKAKPGTRRVRSKLRKKILGALRVLRGSIFGFSTAAGRKSEAWNTKNTK